MRPAKMSRVDYHNLISIVRVFSAPCVLVRLDNGVARGGYSETHEEGYSSVGVEAYSNGDGTYQVRVHHSGRDCDGRVSQFSEYTVQKTAHRKRYYVSRDWKNGNRPMGKFGIRSEWSIVRVGRSRQRDYTAESMGY